MYNLNLKQPLNQWLARAKRNFTNTKAVRSTSGERYIDEKLKKIEEERRDILKWARL